MTNGGDHGGKPKEQKSPEEISAPKPSGTVDDKRPSKLSSDERATSR